MVLKRDLCRFALVWRLLFVQVYFVLTLAAPSWGAEILNLEECLKIAEAHHPLFDQASSKTRTEKARLKQTALPDRLSLSGNATVSRLGTDERETADYSTGFTSSLKIYDSQRTKYAVSAQRNLLEASRESELDTRLQVRLGVKAAYITLQLNMAIEQQRYESVKAFERHLARAESFYELGERPRYDVTKAGVNAGNARLALIEAKNAVYIAKAELLNAMGITSNEDILIAREAWTLPEHAERDAEKLALIHRSDYKAALLSTLAGEASLRSDARSSSPTVSLSGGYNRAGDDVFQLEEGWNAGIKMSIPVLDGGEQKARFEAAKGQLGVLQASQEKLRQDILLAVRKGIANLASARERIEVSRLTLNQAEENRTLAEGRYEVGVGDALEVTDALLSLSDAQLVVVQADYDLHMAMIELERAVGIDFRLPKKEQGALTENPQ